MSAWALWRHFGLIGSVKEAVMWPDRSLPSFQWCVSAGAQRLSAYPEGDAEKTMLLSAQGYSLQVYWQQWGQEGNSFYSLIDFFFYLFFEWWGYLWVCWCIFFSLEHHKASFTWFHSIKEKAHFSRVSDGWTALQARGKICTVDFFFF